MQNQNTKRMPTKPKAIDVRYKPTRATIQSKLKTHFATYQLDLEERGAIADVTKLIQFMGITPHRWKELIHNDAPPLLCEVASYAEYMMIDINQLYQNIPYPIKKAA